MPATVDGSADEIDLAEIMQRPAIGNYRGYAEFKMAQARDAALAAEWLKKSAAAGYAPAVEELKPR